MSRPASPHLRAGGCNGFLFCIFDTAQSGLGTNKQMKTNRFQPMTCKGRAAARENEFLRIVTRTLTRLKGHVPYAPRGR